MSAQPARTVQAEAQISKTDLTSAQEVRSAWTAKPGPRDKDQSRARSGAIRWGVHNPAHLHLMRHESARREGRQNDNQGPRQTQNQLPQMCAHPGRIDRRHRRIGQRATHQLDHPQHQIVAHDSKQNHRRQPASSRSQLGTVRQPGPARAPIAGDASTVAVSDPRT